MFRIYLILYLLQDLPLTVSLLFVLIKVLQKSIFPHFPYVLELMRLEIGPFDFDIEYL
jgi:hypothetical protein